MLNSSGCYRNYIEITMLIDAQGLRVSTDSPDTVAQIDKFTQQMLSYGNQSDQVLTALGQDPANVLLNAHAAALQLFNETADAPQRAIPYLQTAQTHVAKATEREQLYVEAISAWAVGKIDRAIAYHQVLAQHYPRDLVAVLIGQYHYFYQGNSQAMLDLIQTIFPANQENHFVHGMLAFALEQCRQLEAAEIAGRRAVEMDRHDPWAHHAVAHVLETQQRRREGIAWMESFADTWESCGSFYTHNWWHVALYYLDLGDYGKALEIYDQQIWGRAVKSYSQCQVDAIALLIRLELYGLDVGNRWQAVFPYFVDHLDDHILPFIDVHYGYALVRVGQAGRADDFLQRLTAHAETAESVWGRVALPISQAMIAYAKGDSKTAVTQFELALPHLQTLGGSHAQRDLFHRVYRAASLHHKLA